VAKILIVDDEPVVLDVLRRLLEEDGRDIALATSPAEAIATANRGLLDVALVDKNLQGASGLDLSRALKSSSSPDTRRSRPPSKRCRSVRSIT